MLLQSMIRKGQKKQYRGKASIRGSKNRYALIDGIRGIAVVNMVAFHFLYDVFIVYAKNIFWYDLSSVHIWQQFICWTFILVSGFVWHWGGSSNVRRSLELNLWGLVITLVTWITVPQNAVYFGILNFLGCAVLLMVPLYRFLKKVPSLVGIVVSFFAFILFKNVENGILGIGSIELMRLPEALYATWILVPLGFPRPDFYSSDYFPLLPWMFLFLTGHFMGILFETKDSWKHIARKRIPVLSKIGEKSIWIYLIHQPVCMLLCGMFF